MSPDKIRPKSKSFPLFSLRREKRPDTAAFKDRTEALKRVDNGLLGGILLQRPVEIYPGRKHIDRSQIGICALREESLKIVHIRLLAGSHIIDIRNVGVEFRLCAEKSEDNCQDKNQPDKLLGTVGTQFAKSVEQTVLPFSNRSYFYKMRKIEKYKNYRSREQKRCEQAQIPESHSLERHESEKCTDSRDVPHNKRRYDFTDCPPHRRGIGGVDHKVEGIVHCDSENDA